MKDKDLIGADDEMGYCDVNWKEAIEKPGTWAVNNIQELQSTPNIDTGK